MVAKIKSYLWKVYHNITLFSTSVWNNLRFVLQKGYAIQKPSHPASIKKRLAANGCQPEELWFFTVPLRGLTSAI